MTDCLDDLMDTDGLRGVARSHMHAGEVTVTARDLPTPSPLAQEIITAKPFAFLDDAPAEERRTQAIRCAQYAGCGRSGRPGAVESRCGYRPGLCRGLAGAAQC